MREIRARLLASALASLDVTGVRLITHPPTFHFIWMPRALGFLGCLEPILYYCFGFEALAVTSIKASAKTELCALEAAAACCCVCCGNHPLMMS